MIKKLDFSISREFKVSKVGEANIRKFTTDTYNEYSGLAIQYMFNYKRNNNVQ